MNTAFSMNSSFHRNSTRIVALLLFLLGVSKALDYSVRDDYYQEPDALFQVFTNGQMLLIGAVFEISVATMVWMTEAVKTRSLILVWFSTVVGAYKTGLLFVPSVRPCACLGILGKLLHLGPTHLERVTWLLLVVIALLGALAWSDLRKSEVSAGQGE